MGIASARVHTLGFQVPQPRTTRVESPRHGDWEFHPKAVGCQPNVSQAQPGAHPCSQGKCKAHLHRIDILQRRCRTRITIWASKGANPDPEINNFYWGSASGRSGRGGLKSAISNAGVRLAGRAGAARNRQFLVRECGWPVRPGRPEIGNF